MLYPDEHGRAYFWKILFCPDKSWWNYFNKILSNCWPHPMLSFWILLLEQFLLMFLTFPESAGAGVRSSSVIWCAACHAGMKGRSRAAERLLYCHMSPVVLAGTPDAHCALIREQGKAQPICHCALMCWLLKLPWRAVSKADSKNQTISHTLFLVGLFLKIFSRLTQKEGPVWLWNKITCKWKQTMYSMIENVAWYTGHLYLAVVTTWFLVSVGHGSGICPLFRIKEVMLQITRSCKSGSW